MYIGYCSPPVTVDIRVQLRAIYNHIIITIQVLLSGGSTQNIYDDVGGLEAFVPYVRRILVAQTPEIRTV